MLLLPSTGYNAIANAHDSCSSDADCKVTLSIGDVCINAVGLLSCQSGQCDIIGVGTSEATVVEMSSVNGYGEALAPLSPTPTHPPTRSLGSLGGRTPL
jgi:hypothetical protein